MGNMDITLLLATYGAVLGTLSFVLSIYLATRERRKDKRVVKVILEFLAFAGLYQIRIVNTNFRPVTITNIGADLYVRNKILWEWLESVPAGALLDPPRGHFLFR